jgi:hypothetical protein
MARAAASTMLFKRALGDLDGQSLKVDRALKQTTTSSAGVSQEFDRGASSLDKYSGRLSLVGQGLAAFGPAAVPIAAVAVPAVTALADALGVAVLAGGTAVLALQGVGDALGKLNKAQLDPTTANLKAAQLAFEGLTAKASEFVLQLDAAGPALTELKKAAGSGLFDGLSAGLSGALTQLPAARDLLASVSGALGNLGQMTGDSLASGKWGEFLTFLTTTAPPAIESLGRTVGNLASGLADLWMAFDPLNTSVIGMLENGSQAFQDWADGLSATDGFKEFVSYLQTSGPQVADALAQVGNAFLQIVEAAAPIGGPVLQVVESLARAISTIADSPIGTPLFGLVAAMSALSLATRGYESVRASAFGSAAVGNFTAVRAGLNTVITAQDRATMSAKELATAQKTQAAGWDAAGKIGKTTAALAGLGIVASGVADKVGLSNTASLAMAGTLAGPWGAALGAGVGALLDFKAAGDSATDGINGLQAAIASGNADALAAKVKEAQDELDALGSSNPLHDEMAAAIGEASSKLADLQAKARGAAQAESELSNYTSGVNRALYDQNAAMAESIKVMQAQRSEALRAADAHLNYRAAILDAKDALKSNGQTVNENTRAGQANLQALHALASGWNNQSDAAKNAQGSLRAAKANFIETASSMGMAEGKARTLAKRLFEIPSSRVTTVTINDAATQKLIGIRNELASIKDKSVYVGVRGPGVGGMGPQLRAEGGYIAGPGTATSDSIPARLSNGEYVVKASAVSRYGVAMMDTINAQRFASGGKVSAPSARSSRAGFWAPEDFDMSGGLRGMKARLNDLEHSVKRATDAVDLQKESLDKETSARDDLVNQFGSLASSIAGQFQSNLFEPLNDVFGSSSTTSDPISVLMGDLANSSQFSSLFAGLQGRGLSGAALTAAAQGGTGALQTLGSYSDADLARYADLYAQREQLNSSTGAQVAQAQFGAALAIANANTTAANAKLDQANAYLADLAAQTKTQTQAVKQVESATKDNGKAVAKSKRSRK